MPTKPRPDPIMRARNVAASVRERGAERATSTGEQQRLGKRLAYQAKAARAERHAHGQLLLPRCGAREQEARDVRARDQEEQADCRHQTGERSAELIAQRREAGGRRFHLEPEVAQERRVFRLREIVAHWTIEDLQLSERLLDRRVRLEPADHLYLQRAGPALAWWLNDRLVRRGDPHVRLDADLQPEELTRRDSDDGQRRLVDRDRRAERGGIEVEAPLPVQAS